MKKLIALITLSFLFVSVSHADSVFMKRDLKVERKKKLYCYPFTVRFPFGTCRTKTCGKSSNPHEIKGYACGIYVDCFMVGINRYSCYY